MIYSKELLHVCLWTLPQRLESPKLTTKNVNANSLTYRKGEHCVGNNEKQFLELGLDSKTACIENVSYKTIRHAQCSLFLEESEKCLAVKNTAVHYINTCQQSEADPKPDLMLRCKNLETQQGSDSVKLKALKAKIKNPTSKHDVQVSQETSRMFQTAINEELLNGIENKYPRTTKTASQLQNRKCYEMSPTSYTMVSRYTWAIHIQV